ncbi:MAG: hypothetical protein ACOC8O_04575 [Natronomonas sp.]
MLERSNALLVVAGIASILVLVATGFAPVPVNDSQPDESLDRDPASLVSNMTDSKPEYVEGDLSFVTEHNGTELDRKAYEVAERPKGDTWRVHIDDEATDLTLVANESTVWSYDKVEREVVRIDRDEGGVVVPAIEFDHYADVTDDFELRYEGFDRVAGRDAHVVVFSDPADAEPTASIELLIGENAYQLAGSTIEEPMVLDEHRLWIDRETAYPLKERTEMTSPDGETITITTEYDRIAFDGDPPPDVFEFEPPADAEVRTPSTASEYDSIDAAAEAVPYAIPDPDVPDGFDLRRIAVREINDGIAVFVVYWDGTDRVTVSASPSSGHDVNGLAVDVNGQPGTLVDTASGSSIQWSCSDRTYRVIGTLSAEAQLEVAESVDCG